MMKAISTQFTCQIKKHSCRQGDPYQDRPTLIRLQWNNWIHHNNLLSPSVHLCLSVSFSNVNFGLPSSPPLAILACRSSRLFAAAAGSTHTTHTMLDLSQMNSAPNAEPGAVKASKERCDSASLPSPGI